MAVVTTAAAQPAALAAALTPVQALAAYVLVAKVAASSVAKQLSRSSDTQWVDRLRTPL
ncbi:hypothetical protein OAN61_00860 [bacterium]|nr:hypothetical protein [bacterium]